MVERVLGMQCQNFVVNTRKLGTVVYFLSQAKISSLPTHISYDDDEAIHNQG